MVGNRQRAVVTPLQFDLPNVHRLTDARLETPLLTVDSHHDELFSRTPPEIGSFLKDAVLKSCARGAYRSVCRLECAVRIVSDVGILEDEFHVEHRKPVP